MSRLVPTDARRPLDGLTRRSLLRASCGVGVAGLLSATAGCSLEEVLRRGQDAPLAAGTPILVVLTMYGGNDGLNTLVPYADPAYARARPHLAYAGEEVLDLGDGLGLSPALTGLKSLWDQRKVAIVRGVGYPNPNRSHFESMDIWQSASPDRPVSTGWVGRWLDTIPSAERDPLQALGIGSVLPPMLVGATRSAAALELGLPRLRPEVSSRVKALGAPDPRDTSAAALVAASYADTVRVDTELLAPLKDLGSEGDLLGDARGTKDGRTDAGSVGAAFDLVARCIAAGAPTRVYAISLNGFDTHAGEKASHELLLGSVDEAITAFRAALSGQDRERDVVVLAYSEFGRRLTANASEGTDHGTASSLFLIGDAVSGGFHGEQPSLTDLSDGDLKATTDFRSVLGAVCEKVLRVDPEQIVPGVPSATGGLTANTLFA